MTWAPYWPYLLPLLALPWVWPWVRHGSWCDVPLWHEWIRKGDEEWR